MDGVCKCSVAFRSEAMHCHAGVCRVSLKLVWISRQPPLNSQLVANAIAAASIRASDVMIGENHSARLMRDEAKAAVAYISGLAHSRDWLSAS